MIKLILLSFLFFIIDYVFTPNPIPFPHKQNLSKFERKYDNIGLNWTSLPKIILSGSCLVVLLWIFLLYSCDQVKYITFNTNLSLYKKKSTLTVPQLMLYLSLMLSWLLLTEYPEAFIQLSLHYCPNFAFLIKLDPNVYKRLARTCFHTSCVLIFIDAISPASLILSIFVLQINVPQWLPFILILLANDIELNPGSPSQN